MKKFILKIIAFSIPLIIIFLIPITFLFMSGENYRSIENIIKNNKNYLIGYAYNEGNYKYLKEIELKHRPPQDIIALGSSRILQFRDKMFTNKFYNAGYTISSISDFIPFIRTNLESKKPEILLIALDQWMFNENWDNLKDYDTVTKKWTSTFSYKASIRTIFKIWSDLFNRKYGFEIFSNNGQKIGLNAIVNNKGFRKDGSIFYGTQIQKLLSNDNSANDFEYSDTYLRIKNGNRRFQYANKINNKSLNALDDLLLLCENMNIYVIAVLPPFADSVNLKMKQSKNYAYIDNIYSKANKLFKKYKFELWDMSNLSKYGSNDNETIDGFHGSEVSYIKMLIYMIENDSKLKRYTNIEKLKYDLKNKNNNYLVY